MVEMIVEGSMDGGEIWLPSDAEGEAKVAEWLSKSANEVHQGPWMVRAIYPEWSLSFNGFPCRRS